MIRATMISSDSSKTKIIETFLTNDIKDLKIQDFHQSRQYDIYFIEIQCLKDLEQIKNLKRNIDTLIYIIGPTDFEMIQESVGYSVNLYLKKDDLKNDLYSHKEVILKHIQQSFRFYSFQNGSMKVRIRLSDIYYIESLRHKIIIHSINGELCERKNLKDLMKEIANDGFIQVYKSFVVNKRKIQRYNAKEIYLSNGDVLPLGRIYKEMMNKL